MNARLTNWLAASLIALVLSIAYLLDGPTELEATQDVAADLHDAITLTQVAR